MTPILVASWTLFAGAMVLFLPGLAWQALFWDPEQGTFERLADAIGMSIALTAFLALLAYLAGWRFRPATIIFLYLLLAFPAFWTLRRWWRERTWGIKSAALEDGKTPGQEASAELRKQWSPQMQGKLVYLILTLIFLVVLIWRFFQIRDIVLPLWVDSIHHVQIVVLFLENGGIPENFEPYMPVPFYYHYAFHSIAAVFSFFSRLNPPDAVLYLGQILNAVIALAVYRLGKALWGGWRRAALSAILVAFVTQMPAYYVTWGRYTLLTGMVLLPVAMAGALDIVNKGAKVSRILTFIILTTGILLSHYFAAALLAIFLIVLSAQVLILNVKNKIHPVWSAWSPLLLASLVGLLLAGPWLYRMWGYAQQGVKVVAIQPTLEAVNTLYFPEYLTYLWRLLGPDRNQALLFVALPGLIISIFRRRTRAFGVWTILLAVLSLPVGFYVAPFRPDHAVIVLFLPTALMVAELLISIIDWSPIEKLSSLKVVAVLVIFTIMVGWGIYETRTVINSATILAAQDDLDAINWIDGNTPPEARFAINVTHWQYGSYRGIDGGWWITPLTARMTSLPNGLYGMGDDEYTEQVNYIAGRFSQAAGCSSEFWELIRVEGLTHIYLSAARGSMQPDQFENCSGVELIYQNKSVYLYRIEYN